MVDQATPRPLTVEEVDRIAASLAANGATANWTMLRFCVDWRRLTAENEALRKVVPSAVGLEITAGMLASDGHVAAADEMRQIAAAIRAAGEGCP